MNTQETPTPPTPHDHTVITLKPTAADAEAMLPENIPAWMQELSQQEGDREDESEDFYAFATDAEIQETDRVSSLCAEFGL